MSTTAGAPRVREAVQSSESANSAVAQKVVRYCNVISDGLNGAWNKQLSFCLRLSACNERVRTSKETDNKQSCLQGPLKRVRGRAFVGFTCRITSQRQLWIQSSSQRRDADRKEMKGKAKGRILDLDMLLFLCRGGAGPSHVLLFMSERSHGVF